MDKNSLDEIPARLLNLNERLIISMSMDQRLIREIDGSHLPRDFRGLGQLMGIDPSFVREAEENKKPVTEEMLFMWEKKESNTIGKLIEMFEILGRYDIIQDLFPVLNKRIPEMKRKLKKSNGEIINASKIKIVSRSDWGAVPSRMLKPLNIPVQYLIIHHTGYYKWEGYSTIKNMQVEHMRKIGATDVVFNFIINQEGHIFEGSGWDQMPGNTTMLSTASLLIGLLGNFETEIPSKEMIEALEEFIQMAIDLNYLEQKYSLYGFRDVASWCRSPGKHVIDIISTWPSYRASGELRDTENFRSGLGSSAEMNTAENYFKSEPQVFICDTIIGNSGII